MRSAVRWFSLIAVAAMVPGAPVSGQVALLAPTDPILAIDFDFSSRSSYPVGEEPFNALDEDPFTKYLNFGQRNSGMIVTPINGALQVRSMVFTTANDVPPRDPASWSLWGTNDPIVSLDNSDGNGGETWTFIDSGAVMMPDLRFTDGPVIPVNSTAAFSSYRLVFPSVKESCGANSMQIADVRFFESDTGMGSTFLTFADDIRAIHFPTAESNYPCDENPPNALDGDTATKYLNFGRENSGFIVTPDAGSSIVTSFQITTANDFDVRDPTSWELYGTNEAIVSGDNSQGNGESWTLIESGLVDLPLTRFTPGPMVPVTNSTAYESYRMVFPTLRDPLGAGADSIQYSEIQFFGDLATLGGDFNNDGFFDCLDVDALVGEIVAMTHTGTFDLTGDGLVNSADLDAWLVNAGANNVAQTGGDPYLKGDANLDGFVDGSDFGVWNSNKFTSVAEWCSGDFNADGVVDGSDFGIWNSNKFQSADSQVVPEPGVAALWLLLILAGARSRR